MSESDELFSLRQEFFTGEFSKVSQISTDEYFDEAKDVALEYKIRSLVLLGQYDAALTAADETEDAVLSKVVKAYTKFSKGDDVSSEFDEIVSTNKDHWAVQILGGLYLIKSQRVDEAIELLHRHETSLECVLLLVQLYLQQGKLELAEKELNNASSYSNDSIIYNLAEAYVNSVKNGDSLRGSLYFFEELSHSHPTYKTLLGELVLNLQLKQFPEADVVLTKLNELSSSSDQENADLIANEYAFANIKGDLKEAEAKMGILQKIDPTHPIAVQYNEKSTMFDELVEKYKEQIVN